MNSKKCLLMAFLCIPIIGMAQENDDNITKNLLERKHELRIDALEGLIVPAIDLSYEYVFSKYAGAGITLFINLDDNGFSEYQNFAISPYYRQYLFNKKEYGARGFFAEGLLQYASGNFEEYNFENGFYTITNKNWNTFGIGVSLGQKWVSNNGFIIELSFGGGRYFNTKEYYTPEGFFRGGVLLGYRF